MKLSSYAQKLGIHYNTAYRLFKRGQIAGTVIIEEPVEKAVVTPLPGQAVAVYARVSQVRTQRISTKRVAVASLISAPRF